MEERGFLSDKFGQYQPEPSPTAWARVQQQMYAGSSLAFWQKSGFLWVSACLLLASLVSISVIWSPSENETAMSITSSPKVNLPQATNHQAQTPGSVQDILAESSLKTGESASSVLADNNRTVTNLGSSKPGFTTIRNAKTYQEKQQALLKASQIDYVASFDGASSDKKLVDMHEIYDQNLGIDHPKTQSNDDISAIIPPKMAGLHWLVNGQENSIQQYPFSINKPFAHYPVSISFWGGLMMNYYNINPEFSVKSQQLPATLSRHRTGFELGATVAKPLTKRVDGFLSAGLGWHQYKAQFKSTSDSVLDYQLQQGSGQELVYFGKFTDRTYQFNLKSLYMQLSGGLLLRNVAGPVSLRLGAGVVLSRIQSETNLVSNISPSNNESEIGFSTSIGLPFHVNLNNSRNLLIEPTLQYFVRHKITVPGVATLHPVQLGVRVGLN